MTREAGSPLGRLPVRVRVTLAFAGVMAVVLLATGLFVYLRLAADLDATIDQGLRSRASDVAALVARSGGTLAAPGRPQLVEPGEDLAQVLDESGRIVGATRDFGRAPLPSAAARRGRPSRSSAMRSAPTATPRGSSPRPSALAGGGSWSWPARSSTTAGTSCTAWPGCWPSAAPVRCCW